MKSPISPPQRGGAVPDHVWVGSKWLLAFPRVPVTLDSRLPIHAAVNASRLNLKRELDWKQSQFRSAMPHATKRSANRANLLNLLVI